MTTADRGLPPVPVPGPQDHVQQVYRVDRRIALMGALAFAGICVIGALLMLVVSTTDDAALFLLFAMLSAVFGPIAAGVGLTMDGTGLTLHRYFGRSRKVGWNDILAIHRRPQGIVVTAADGRRFLAPDRITYDMLALLHRVHRSMISLDELAQEMRRWHERYHATPGPRPGERAPARPLAAVVPATLVGMVLVPGAMLFAGLVGTFGGLYDLRIAAEVVVFVPSISVAVWLARWLGAGWVLTGTIAFFAGLTVVGATMATDYQVLSSRGEEAVATVTQVRESPGSQNTSPQIKCELALVDGGAIEPSMSRCPGDEGDQIEVVHDPQGHVPPMSLTKFESDTAGWDLPMSLGAAAILGLLVPVAAIRGRSRQRRLAI